MAWPKGFIHPNTEKALKLVDKGWTMYAAAKKCGIDYTTLWRQVQKRKKNG